MESVDKAKAVAPVDEFRKALTTMEGQFKLALPPHITPEKFARVVMTAVQIQPGLLNADRKTLFSACLRAAQDGLLPDGREAALVTYRTKNGGSTAQYLPMVGGILKKVRNSGELASITSQLVYSNDQFNYWVDSDGEHVEHKPDLFSERGKLIGVYALAKTKDGAIYVEVMNTNQVMAVRESSKAKDGPWNGPFEGEMWRKTAIRRLSKRLPLSTDLEQVIHRDDELYDLNAANANYMDKGKKVAQMIGLTTSDQTQSPEEVENNDTTEEGGFANFDAGVILPKTGEDQGPKTTG